MDPLRKQHTALIYSSIIFWAAVYYFLRDQDAHFRETAEFLDSFGVTWVLAPAILIAAYEWFGWRLINPEVDFVGYWDGAEKQYKYQDSEPTFDYDAWCEMRVRQDVRRIMIVEGRTHPGLRSEQQKAQTMWYSTACELEPQGGRITATLNADTSPVRPGGAVESEVETFFVTQRGFLGRPIELQSHVRMTAGSKTPRFVIVDYTRRKSDLHKLALAMITARPKTAPSKVVGAT